SVAKVFSGWLSDRLGNRKWLTVAGYGLAALTKPVFALAGTPAEVLAARFADRVGKGIPGAPRGALGADVTPVRLRGTGYGLRQALDTVGAFVGPLMAIFLMLAYAGDMRAVFAWAVVPAAIAVALAIFGVQEPGRAASSSEDVPIRFSDIARVGAAYWTIV